MLIYSKISQTLSIVGYLMSKAKIHFFELQEKIIIGLNPSSCHGCVLELGP